MKAYTGYEKGKATAEAERLPIGGYILKILKAEEITYDWGRKLKLSFDIADGDFKDFYKQNYNGQEEPKKWKGTLMLTVPNGDDSEKDQKRKKYFESQIACIEESNKGYEWDWNEEKLKGKLVGAVFGNQEYDFDGKSGFFTKCFGLRTVDAIKGGHFKIPKDRLLDKTTQSEDGFYPTKPGEDDEDAPF